MDIRRSTIVVFGSQILRNVISFGAIAFFSRSVGISMLGSFFLFQSLISMLSIPVDLGIKTGIEKKLSEGESPADTLATGLLIKMGLLLGSLGGIYLLRARINAYIGADVSLLLAIALLLHELGQLGRHTLRGEKRVAESAIYQPMRTLIWAIAGGVFVYYGFSAEALFWGYIVALLTVLVFSWLLVDAELGSPSIERAKSLVGYSKFAMVGLIGGLIYNWTDVLLIGYFISQSAVGSYEVAWRVATVSLLLSNAVRISIFPSANSWGADDEIHRLESLITRSMIPSFYLVVPIAIGGTILGKDLLSLIFSVEYPLIHIALMVLFVEKLQRAFLLPLIAPMHAIGHVDYGAYTTLLGVVGNIVLNIVLIPVFGVIGAAAGTTLGAFINTVAHTYLLSGEINVRLPVTELFLLAVSGGMMGIVVLVAKAVFNPISLIELAGIIIAGGFTYLLFTMLFPTIRGELKQTMQSIT